MKLRIRNYASYDLKHTAINSLWRLISGPLMLVFIPLFLTPNIQGYWYTFISLAALAVFADLGFSNILLQFAAHEFAFLDFDESGKLSGDKDHLRRLTTLFLFSLKWASFLILVAFPTIIIIGYYFLSQKDANISWFFPWVLYTFASALGFFNSIMLSFFEGCNSVGNIQKIRLRIAILASFLTLGGLLLGLELYTLSISLTFSSLFGLYQIVIKYRHALKQLIQEGKTEQHKWGREIFPLLWRYAISFASGYFIFQIYTPIMFYFYGPVEAGKIGISITLWTAIFGISNIWMVSVTPKINIYISEKKWEELDRMFIKNLILSLLTFLSGMIFALALLYFLTGRIHLFDRFLGLKSMSILSTGWLIQLAINSIAIYLRSHKEEPLVLLSFIAAIYIFLTTLLCAKYLPSDYYFLGFLTSFFWQVPWVLRIYLKKKKSHTIGLT